MFAPTGTSTFGTNRSLKSHWRHHQRYLIWTQSQYVLCCPELVTVLIFCIVDILIALNISLPLNRKISTMTTLPARVSRGLLSCTEHERREWWIDPSPKNFLHHSICFMSRTCTPCHQNSTATTTQYPWELIPPRQIQISYINEVVVVADGLEKVL